jgi:hypothetical protein
MKFNLFTEQQTAPNLMDLNPNSHLFLQYTVDFHAKLNDLTYFIII